MTEQIRIGIVTRLLELAGGCPVYGEEMPQNGRTSCFGIRLKEVGYEKKTGRCRVTPVWEIAYYVGQGEPDKRRKLLEQGMALLRELEMVQTMSGEVRLTERSMTPELRRAVITCKSPYWEVAGCESEPMTMRKREIRIEEEMK